MDLNKIDYADFVEKLAKPGDDILGSLTPEDCHLLHMAVGIAGEAGELLDAVKKAVIYRRKLDMVNVTEELGDLEFYMQGMRSSLGITREETIFQNKAKLAVRYSSMSYTNEQAQERADKKDAE